MKMDEKIKKISEILIEKGLTIGTCESCTAGLISASLASKEGASRYFRGGIVAYATDLKTRLLDVSDNVINENDVVSYKVAESMALGGLYKLNVDICVAITGYIGKNGGSETTANGTVWICTAKFNGSDRVGFKYKQLYLSGNRGENAEKCIEGALSLIEEHLKENK